MAEDPLTEAFFGDLYLPVEGVPWAFRVVQFETASGTSGARGLDRVTGTVILRGTFDSASVAMSVDRVVRTKGIAPSFPREGSTSQPVPAASGGRRFLVSGLAFVTTLTAGDPGAPPAPPPRRDSQTGVGLLEAEVPSGYDSPDIVDASVRMWALYDGNTVVSHPAGRKLTAEQLLAIPPEGAPPFVEMVVEPRGTMLYARSIRLQGR